MSKIVIVILTLVSFTNAFARGSKNKRVNQNPCSPKMVNCSVGPAEFTFCFNGSTSASGYLTFSGQTYALYSKSNDANGTEIFYADGYGEISCRFF